MNDLVYVKYNRKIDTRFKNRIAEGSDFDPLILEDLQWDNEWINVNGDLGHPNEDLWGADVDRVVGPSSSKNGRGRNTRAARDGEAAGDEDESNEAETGEDDFDQLIVEDEDLEDDYGMGSDPGQYSDLEGSRILTTDGSHIFKL